MSPQNLTAVYNQNPTLQSQYTLQQYLDMFGGSSTGTTTTTPTTTTPTTTTPVQGIINQNINQYQGGGGEGDSSPPGPPTDPYAGLGYSSANFGLGNMATNKDAVMDYEADAYNVGRTLPGQLSKFGLAAFNAFKNIPTPFNLMRKAYEFTKQKELEKKAQEEAIARDIAREMQASNRASRTGGYQAGYDSGFMDGPSGAGTGNSPSDKGGSDSMGSFARGGFVRGSYFNGGIVSLRRR